MLPLDHLSTGPPRRKASQEAGALIFTSSEQDPIGLHAEYGETLKRRLGDKVRARPTCSRDARGETNYARAVARN
eukprot:1513122-Alexandrium_andersonii.AAC.1